MISRRSTIALLGATSALALAPRTALAFAGPVYKDASAPVEMRVKDLLGRMTLDEKCAQLITLWQSKQQVMDDRLMFDPAKADKAYPHGIGQMARPSDRNGAPQGQGGRARTPAETIELINGAQKWALQKTRLGIPILFHEEALHGYMAPEATSFPQAIAMAGSFDRDLVRKVNAVIAREMRACGPTLALSPVVDIARDPRWGRIEETFGEDPYLCGEMGVAAVEGMQGKGRVTALAPDKIYATLKHMTGHGQPVGGNNISPAPIGRRELRASFFPPFREVIRRCPPGAVMPSYNEIDGVPSHTNTWLLKDVLRTEWGFDGLVVSDYAAIDELATLHFVAADMDAAAARAINAGVDSDLPDGRAYRSLADAVRGGRIPEAAVDMACTHMLRLKFRSGLFEWTPADAAKAAALIANDEARKLALDGARKCIALLTNDGTLPLKPGAHRKIAVIGPNAAITRLGGYSSVPRQTVTLLDGIKAVLGGKSEIVHAQGVRITQSDDRGANEILLGDPVKNRQLIAEAVDVARDADVIILAIGDTEQTSREGWAKNHLGDRIDIDIVGDQNALFDALHGLGKPIVVTAINGRPPSWPNIIARANAILECWYLGQEGGLAMAEAVFGLVNPGAKLPVTVVRNAGQIPFYNDRKPTSRRGYLFSDASALFPFGHGLSYTTFKVGAPKLSARKIGPKGKVTVTVDVTNTGKVAGDEVVQLYVRDQHSSVTRPLQELKGFERVTLKPGETRSVKFTLGPDAFALWNAQMKEVVEPGLFDIMVGPSSAKTKTAVLEIS